MLEYIKDIFIDALPKTGAYSPDNQYYTEYYEKEDICTCGTNNWIIFTISIDLFGEGLCTIPQRLQRCSKCKKIRIVSLKKEVQELIDFSDIILSQIMEKFQTKDLSHQFFKYMFIKLEELKNNEISQVKLEQPEMPYTEMAYDEKKKESSRNVDVAYLRMNDKIIGINYE